MQVTHALDCNDVCVLTTGQSAHKRGEVILDYHSQKLLCTMQQPSNTGEKAAIKAAREASSLDRGQAEYEQGKVTSRCDETLIRLLLLMCVFVHNK